MKRLFVIGMALAFTLGIAGLGFSADQGTMKHEDVKVCGNANCCDQARAAKKAVPVRKPQKDIFPWVNQYQFGGG